MSFFDQLVSPAAHHEWWALLFDGGSLSPLEQKILFKRFVRIINLELSYRCNRKCDSCPVKASDRRTIQRTMDEGLLQKICGELAEIRWDGRFSLNLYNEPLLDERLEERVRTIRSALPGCEIFLNTNGDYLTGERLTSLAEAGLNDLTVTLHRRPGRDMKTSLLVRRIEKLVGRWVDDAGRIDFLSLVEDAPFPSIESEIDGVRLRLQWPDWRVYGSNRGGTLADHVTMATVRTVPCVMPVDEFTIYCDGLVQPCCESFHDGSTTLVPMGNAADDSLFTLYASKEMSDFRRALFTPGEKVGICRHCPVQVNLFKKPAD